MGWADHAIAELAEGNGAIVKPHGNSMLPRITSGQRVFVRPYTKGDALRLDDVVLVRVRGSTLLHLVSAIDGERVQISNNHGHVNGWVRRSAIYGVADV